MSARNTLYDRALLREAKLEWRARAPRVCWGCTAGKPDEPYCLAPRDGSSVQGDTTADAYNDDRCLNNKQRTKDGRTTRDADLPTDT